MRGLAMENPLLNHNTLPQFSQIIPEVHIEPAIRQVIEQNQIELDTLLSETPVYTWENLMAPLEEMGDRLSKTWSPVSHMHSVVESETLRTAYNSCLALLTEYNTKLMQNDELYRAIQSLKDSPNFAKLNSSQQKVIENNLRDFKLAGVSLAPAAKERFAEIQRVLSKLTTQFAENLLDATQGWTLHITDKADLAGLSEASVIMAAETAQEKGKTGWLFTLEFPSYSAVMKYLENRNLRRSMYEAFTTRASDQGPNANRWDNTTVMDNILRFRHELAQLLGFANYAEDSLAIKMAHTPKRVLDFLHDLVVKSKPAAQKEMQELTAFAKERDGITELQAWDMSFYSEKLREQKYSISQEELKPYFPAHKVLGGMFSVVNKLYGLKIVENKDVDTWHSQVSFFDIFNEKNDYIGSFYIDLYARPHKRDGAWMDDCRVRRQLPDGDIQYPVAYLTCNFTRPIGDKPALLTQDEVETVFHEFGHCLHHLLTKINYAEIAGINGVPWDAVEFPSQIMEHWCWEKETIALISGHYETGEQLPEALYKKMLAAKYFQSGMQMLRQVEFSLFDFRIHLEYNAQKGARIQSILDEVRAEVSVTPVPRFNRFQNTFSHIFAGGYAAGYYSYKWAEVLSSDAYSLFEETGVFNRATGEKFLNTILSQGGLCDPMDAFVAFRGREPSIDALLRHSGLVPA